MVNCPACGAPAPPERRVCGCGADLELLHSLNGVADAWFNRALEAAAGGAPGRALEWASACCAARPTDAQALRLLARLWAQLGRPAEAQAALARARVLDPEAPETTRIQAALEITAAPRPASRGKAKRSKG